MGFRVLKQGDSADLVFSAAPGVDRMLSAFVLATLCLLAQGHVGPCIESPDCFTTDR